MGTALPSSTLGGKVGVLDTSVPFGSVDMTTAALVAKQKASTRSTPGSTTTRTSPWPPTEAGRREAQGARLPHGLRADVINSPAWTAVQGDYFDSISGPVGAQRRHRADAAALEKYAHFTTSDFPTFSQYEAWLGADLMIKGIQLAGKNPTQASIIKALRNLKCYNGNGLLPTSINYSTVFGHDPAESCGWYLQRAEKSGFASRSRASRCADRPAWNDHGTVVARTRVSCFGRSRRRRTSAPLSEGGFQAFRSGDRGQRAPTSAASSADRCHSAAARLPEPDRPWWHRR